VRAAGKPRFPSSRTHSAIAIWPLLNLLGESIHTRTISRLQQCGIQPRFHSIQSDMTKAPQLDCDPTTADLGSTPLRKSFSSHLKP
jgi:hypothetical protein